MTIHRTMIVVLLLLAAPLLVAQNAQLPCWLLSSGASQATTGNTAVASSLGEATLGLGAAGNLQILGGFLAGISGGGPVSDVQQSEPMPQQYSLSQSFPNPFNPVTTIRYALPHRSHVTLIVFNALGQCVTELVNGDIEAGAHEVLFNASRLASGVYFYRMVTGSFTNTKKTVLMK